MKYYCILGNNGDIFVQKSPACTIETLANALMELYNKKVDIKVIGIRHGEKIYETLINKEEIVKAEDLGDYYRIPADTRDLNYNKFFSEGETKIFESDEYTSENTKRLNIYETINMLRKLTEIKADLS